MLSHHPALHADPNNPTGTFSIFLEYVSGGSVRNLLDKFGDLSEDLVRNYTRQLLLGLEYLHHNGIAHRDIKAANVLIGNDGVIKLADFGAAKRIARNGVSSLTLSGGKAAAEVEDEDTDKIMEMIKNENDKAGNKGLRSTRGVKGTPLWMAPEVIKETLARNGWKKADIWSVGCTIIEMATGKPPWSQYSNAVTAMYHIACTEDPPTLPESMTSEGIRFLESCFQREPSKRGEVSSILMHPWIMASGRGRNLKSKASSRYVASRGGNVFAGAGDMEASARPSTSAGERLWTAGAGAERWDREKKEREKRAKEKQSTVAPVEATTATSEQVVGSGASTPFPISSPVESVPTTTATSTLPIQKRMSPMDTSFSSASPDGTARKERSRKKGSGKSSKRRSSSKKRSEGSSNKNRGRSKSAAELALLLSREDENTTSPATIGSPPPYQFSSPPENKRQKRRPPRVDTSLERNIAITTTNISFDSDNDGSVSKVRCSGDVADENCTFSYFF